MQSSGLLWTWRYSQIVKYLSSLEQVPAASLATKGAWKLFLCVDILLTPELPRADCGFKEMEESLFFPLLRYSLSIGFICLVSIVSIY